MKKLVMVVLLASVAFSAQAYIKCAPSPMGGSCCWDTDRDGPFKPIGC